MPLIRNKNGLAELVSSVLIILIVISALSIFFVGYIKNYTINLSPEISCTELRINPPIEVKEVCFDANNREVKVSLKRNLDDFNLNLIKFILTQDNLKEEWSCGGNCETCNLLSSGNDEIYIIKDMQVITDPQSLILSIDSCTLKTSSITPCE